MYSRYFEADGKADTAQIILDIKNGKLNRSDVEQLINDERVRDAYTLYGYDPKPEEEWKALKYADTKQYLGRLAFTTGCFSEAYLLHMMEVAEQVETLNNKSNKLIKQVFWVALIAGAIFATLSLVVHVVTA